MSAPAHAAAGRITFRQGRTRYALPLDAIAIEATPVRDRVQYRVSLVYRDARNRTFAIALVHHGPGPLAERLVSDVTVATPAGLSRGRAGASRCELVLSVATAGAIEGAGRCTGLTDFGGEKPALDVTEIRFSGRSAPKS